MSENQGFYHEKFLDPHMADYAILKIMINVEIWAQTLKAKTYTMGSVLALNRIKNRRGHCSNDRQHLRTFLLLWLRCRLGALLLNCGTGGCPCNHQHEWQYPKNIISFYSRNPSSRRWNRLRVFLSCRTFLGARRDRLREHCVETRQRRCQDRPRHL